MLATGADEVVKLWTIPEGGLTKDNMKNPSFEISGPEGEVNSLAFNPLVSNLLAVGSKSNMIVADATKGSEAFKFEVSGYGKDILDVSWDFYGKTVACVTKDYKLCIVDPRSSDSKVLSTTKKCSGFRPNAAVFMGEKGHVIATGVNSSRSPVVEIYDPRMMSESFTDEDLDMSPGYAMPMYDPDTKILYVAVRGSGMLRMYARINK